MMNEVRLRAYAKINLGLDVLGRRENGYHDVSMVMQTISLHDLVCVKLLKPQEAKQQECSDRIALSGQNAEDLQCGIWERDLQSSRQLQPHIELTCNWKFLPTDSRNLAWQAAEIMYGEALRRFPERFSKALPGVYIHLEKHIPAAAGMAGGSTDCAAVLKAMNRLLDLQIPVGELQQIAVSLGADVPYCVCGGTMLAEGIGEILTPLAPMPGCFLLTATPEISVSTKMIYEAIDSIPRTEAVDISGICKGLARADIRQVAEAMGNRMEEVTLPMHPEVGRIRQIMEEKGALRAMMSGSGPTVFGIFRLRSQASAAAGEIERQNLCRNPFISVPCNRCPDEK